MEFRADANHQCMRYDNWKRKRNRKSSMLHDNLIAFEQNKSFNGSNPIAVHTHARPLQRFNAIKSSATYQFWNMKARKRIIELTWQKIHTAVVATAAAIIRWKIKRTHLFVYI